MIADGMKVKKTMRDCGNGDYGRILILCRRGSGGEQVINGEGYLMDIGSNNTGSKVKRFFALWVVSVVIVTGLGFLVALLDFLFGSIETTSYGRCLKSIFHNECYDDYHVFIFYPITAFLAMLFVYPIFRAIVASFKVVFKK